MAADPAYKVLVFSKTAGFRHDAIPAGIAAIQELGAANGFTVDRHRGRRRRSPPPTWPSTRRSSSCSTTGDVLNATQQTAFEHYIARRRRLRRRARRRRHRVRLALVRRARRRLLRLPPGDPAGHRAGRGPRRTRPPRTCRTTWTRTDEWYNYRTNPRSTVHVLATPGRVDLHRRHDGRRPPDRLVPDYDGGRSLYTGVGHTQASYAEPDFRAHLLGGIRYAAGVVAADCGTGTQPPTTGAVEAESFLPVRRSGGR